MAVMQAIISPRTLHELCQVAVDSAAACDLQAAPCAALLSTLLAAGAARPQHSLSTRAVCMAVRVPMHRGVRNALCGAGNLLSLRNLILGRCLNIALCLPKLTHPIVALATTSAGQSVMDNLSHEFPYDAALASVHLFCACSDASVLRKHNRLAVLVATALREAEEQRAERECLATSALVMLMSHLRRLHAAGTEAGIANDSSFVRSRRVRCQRAALLLVFLQCALLVQGCGVQSSTRRSVTSITPMVLRNVNTGRESNAGLSSHPSFATASPHSTTWQASSPAAAFLQPWKSVAEMRRQSEIDCNIEAAPLVGARERRVSGAASRRLTGTRSDSAMLASAPVARQPTPPITKCAPLLLYSRNPLPSIGAPSGATSVCEVQTRCQQEAVRHGHIPRGRPRILCARAPPSPCPDPCLTWLCLCLGDTRHTCLCISFSEM